MYNVSATPHIRSGVTTAEIMRDVMIALIPASAFGVYWFGFSAFLVLLTAITTCVVSEYFYHKFVKRSERAYECSAIVTGLLIGMNLPASAPLWMPVIGGVFAIIVVKEMYGGLGQNIMNPALAARAFLSISFAARMASFEVLPFTASKAGNESLYTLYYGASSIDGITGATPLAALKAGDSISLFDMLFGYTGGVIGETSAVMILIGAIYMLYRKVITLRIPLTYIGSFVVFMILFSGKGFDVTYLSASVLGGGLMLGAFFMATDYTTSPITAKGRIVYGICLGLLTALFRIFGSTAEGVSYAIIFCNLLVPLIERVTMPKAFGRGGKAYVRK